MPNSGLAWAGMPETTGKMPNRSPIDDQPRIVTYNDLLKTLLPYIEGYHWALDTIGDLWRMGAPFGPDKRLIVPGQFKEWWEDVNQRMGHGLRDPFNPTGTV